MRSRPRPVTSARVLGALALMCFVIRPACAFAQPEFERWQMGVEADGSMAHFGARLNQTGWVQAWNLSVHFVLLPFGAVHFARLGGVLDGAPQFGVGPVFERFNTRQNFGGLDFEVRYYLTHFERGPLVPWIEASIAPGGTDLRLKGAGRGTRLEGPFAALIQGGVGLSYFFRKRAAAYLGLHTEHVSNGGFNGPDRNYSINTALGMVVGVSWFFR
jgi:hypothetical protein